MRQDLFILLQKCKQDVLVKIWIGLLKVWHFKDLWIRSFIQDERKKKKEKTVLN